MTKKKITNRIKRLMKRVGDNIRHARLREKMTQVELASKLKISQYHVSRIEWGDQNLKIYLLFKISKALNIMPEEIVDVQTPARFYGNFDARSKNAVGVAQKGGSEGS